MRAPITLVLFLMTITLGACGGGGGGPGGSDAAEVVLFSMTSGEASLWGGDLAGRVPGLVSFNLAFLNGDHHVHQITVGGLSSDGVSPDPDSFLLGLRDGDGGDPVAMSARYFDLQGIATRKVVSGQDLQGYTVLPIEALAPGERIVLCGFSFQTDGTDHHITVLQVTPFASGIGVRYEDDSPGDDLYTATVAYAVIPADRGPDSVRRPTFGDVEDRTRDFAFFGSGEDLRPPSSIALINGFTLRFVWGDRHLERVAVDLESLDRRRATFRDGDPSSTDDEVQAFVRWIRIIP